jgi:hypothetical protein
MRHVVEGRMEIGYQRECIKRYTNYNDMRHVVEGRTFSLGSYFHSTLYHVPHVIVICISFNAFSLASYFHSTLRHVVEGRMEIGC